MDRVCSVSQITAKIKTLLEGEFIRVWVVGEISNCSFASSGHLYFTLKDNQAAINALMFKNAQPYLNFVPTNGQKVVVTGALTIYEPRGTYQIRCDSITLFGTGEILAMLEERKNRLAATGIFSQERKRAIPTYPNSIALITSKSGAALQDILHILTKRRKDLTIRIFPAKVQGDDAAKTLTKQLERVNKYNAASLIIVGRGGGSIEDLLPFSDENFVKAVATSKIPVISAVGHEVDWALCDYAADLRAATPTAAAQLATSDYRALEEKLKGLQELITNSLINRIGVASARLKNLGLSSLKNQFFHKIENFQIKNDNLQQQLIIAMSKKIEQNLHRLELLTQKIKTASPTDLLKRGFVKVLDKNNKVINSTKNLTTNKTIKIEFIDGKATAVISNITSSIKEIANE